jgi:hypothetical protein
MGQSRGRLTRVQLDHVQDELADGRVHLGEVAAEVVLAAPVGQQLQTSACTSRYQ